MQSWHNSLHAAVIMQAGHITAEPLAVTDAEGMPNAEERFEMFRYACEYLPENGYKMYAAGCFARPGYEYRARAMEWNGDDVIGMGVNGGSVYDGYAVRNTNNLKFYIKMPVTLKAHGAGRAAGRERADAALPAGPHEAERRRGGAAVPGAVRAGTAAGIFHPAG